MYIICHYAEIGLKGKNRRFFEEKLIENIKKALLSINFEFAKRISGRIIIGVPDQESKEETISELKKVFGIAYFSFAYSCPQNIEDIKKLALDLALKSKFQTFRVRVKRSNKEFPLISPEIEKEIGAYILGKYQHKSVKISINQRDKIKVDLENPDITFYIEIVENYVFMYTQKYQGLGGLPVGISGKAICLLSGGIDSPVAAFYAMKRGIKIIFVHFYTISGSGPDKKIEDKLKSLVKVLDQYQFHSKLYLIPYLKIQESIFKLGKISFSCVICKRFMLRIAQKIAEEEGAEAIVTGDDIGQVASQTIANIKVIQEAIDIPVIRPVVCQDKIDIIKQAQLIGTYKLSILPEPFYCQKFLPFHPQTKASLDKVKELESKLKISELIISATKRAKIYKF